jgi:hypothetical protein
MDKKEWIKQAKAKQREVLDILKNGIKELVTSEKWTEYLKFQTAFHRYSFRNSMLIMLQQPTATYVKGLKQWKAEFERDVKKTEVKNGIAILAPLMRKVKKYQDNPETGEKEESFYEELYGFKTVYVYDVGQTEGKPLPENLHQRTEGNDAQWLLDCLVKVAKGIGYAVNFEDIGKADGRCDCSKKEITVNPIHPVNHQASVMAHELGHAILHPEDDEHSRGDKEFEAESVAFSVMYQFGVTSESYSFPYIAVWQDGDLEECIKKFESSCERIQRTSSRIIRLVEESTSQKSVAA